MNPIEKKLNKRISSRISHKMKKISLCESPERIKWTSVVLSERTCKSWHPFSQADEIAARTAIASAARTEIVSDRVVASVKDWLGSTLETMTQPNPQSRVVAFQAASVQQV